MKIKWNGIENMIYYYNVYFITNNNNSTATTAIIVLSRLLLDCQIALVVIDALWCSANPGNSE